MIYHINDLSNIYILENLYLNLTIRIQFILLKNLFFLMLFILYTFFI